MTRTGAPMSSTASTGTTTPNRTRSARRRTTCPSSVTCARYRSRRRASASISIPRLRPMRATGSASARIGSTTPKQATSSRSVRRQRRLRLRRALVGTQSPDALLEERQPLRELDVLVGELRDDGRVVEQHEEDEERRDREEHGRRVAGDPEPAGDRVQAAAPVGEDEKRDPGREPEQSVALLEAPSAHELEHDEDQDQRGDDPDDRDSERRHRDAP